MFFLMRRKKKRKNREAFPNMQQKEDKWVDVNTWAKEEGMRCWMNPAGVGVEGAGYARSDKSLGGKAECMDNSFFGYSHSTTNLKTKSIIIIKWSPIFLDLGLIVPSQWDS